MRRAAPGWNRSFVTNPVYTSGRRSFRRYVHSDESNLASAAEACERAKTISRIDLRLACGTHKRVESRACVSCVGRQQSPETCVSRDETYSLYFSPSFSLPSSPFPLQRFSLLAMLSAVENSLFVYSRATSRHFHRERLFSLDTRIPRLLSVRTTPLVTFAI